MTSLPLSAGHEPEESAPREPTGLEAPEVSVVLPVYRCAEVLPELYGRLRTVLEGQPRSWELVFVDDACPAGSLAVLRDLARADRRLVVLALAANVGQHRAVLVALARARGRRVVVMDADLQDPPELVPALLERLENGYAAVFGGRHGRYESLTRLVTSRLYKPLLRALTGLPADAGLFVAMRRDTVDRLLEMDVARPNLVVMIGATARPLTSLPFQRPRRPAGRSAYTAALRLRSAWRALALALRLRCRPPRRAAGRRAWEAPAREVIDGDRGVAEPGRADGVDVAP